jgi:hypothetical protein
MKNRYLLLIFLLRWKLRLPNNGTLPANELADLENLLLSLGSQLAEQELAQLGLSKWSEAQASGVKKIADLLERKFKGEDLLGEELYVNTVNFKRFIALDGDLNPTWSYEPGRTPKETISPPICYVQGTDLIFLPTIKCLRPLETTTARLKLKIQDKETLPVDLIYDATLKTFKTGNNGIAFYLDKTGARVIEYLEVSWFISFGTSNKWENAGISKHQLFVLYKKPPTYYPSFKSGLVYYGCTHGKEIVDDDAQFIDAIWKPFESLSLNLNQFKPDGPSIPFIYYRTPGEGCTQNIIDFAPSGADGSQAIDAECGAFADLLVNVLISQGITSAYIKTVVPVEDKAFLVKNWEFILKTKPNLNYPYENFFTPNSLGGEKTPRSIGNAYAQWVKGSVISIRDLNGVSGQNSPNPYSDFSNHKVVVVNDQLFDPSYGKRFSNLGAWANESIAGYLGDFIPSPSNNKIYLFRAKEASSSSIGVKFN